MTINFKLFAIYCLSTLCLALSSCGGRTGPAVEANLQTITFANTPTLYLHGTTTATARSSSLLPVSFSSATPEICSIDATTGLVTSLTIGTCTIAADQAGNATFAPAPQVRLTIPLTIDPHQTITFGAAPTLCLYCTESVTATANSGLSVSFSSLTPTICTVDASGMVTDLLAGTCTIAADQAGDATYFSAPQVTQNLTVTPWIGAVAVPNSPAHISATVGANSRTAVIYFSGTNSGGSPITGYTINSIPAGTSATGTASPINISCPTTCTGYSFTVTAGNAIGNSFASLPVEIITQYNIVATFFEPDTQPSNSIFTGSFTYNATTSAVTNLHGKLTQSMTGPPMSSVPLNHQLSAVSDGLGGLLVTTFALNTVDTFYGGGFAPATGSGGLYFGFPTAKNPASGGIGNAYAMIYINLNDPLSPITPSQLNNIAYADCTAGGMMGDVCMTGTSLAGYGTIGTMSGYPISQVISKQ